MGRRCFGTERHHVGLSIKLNSGQLRRIMHAIQKLDSFHLKVKRNKRLQYFAVFLPYWPGIRFSAFGVGKDYRRAVYFATCKPPYGALLICFFPYRLLLHVCRYNAGTGCLPFTYSAHRNPGGGYLFPYHFKHLYLISFGQV